MERQKAVLKKGYYLDRVSGELVRFDQLEAVMAKAGGSYVQLPAAAVVLGAPVLSLAYVIFLPLVGLAALIGMELKKIPALAGRTG